jgi:hypothetical protein
MVCVDKSKQAVDVRVVILKTAPRQVFHFRNCRSSCRTWNIHGPAHHFVRWRWDALRTNWRSWEHCWASSASAFVDHEKFQLNGKSQYWLKIIHGA